MGIREKIVGLRECLQFDNRWALVFQRALSPGSALQVYRLGKLEFVVDHKAGDACGTRAALTTPMYRSLLPLTELPTDRPLRVADLGANGGGFALLLIAAGYRIEKLAAVELNPATGSRLRFNLERNLARRHQVFIAALTADGRELELTLGQGGTSDSIYHASHGGVPTKIRGITFDEVASSLGPESIDLVKMDIEGAEAEVLFGDTSDRLSSVKALIIEIHDAESVPSIRHRLARYGLHQVASPLGDGAGVYLFRMTPVASSAKAISGADASGMECAT